MKTKTVINNKKLKVASDLLRAIAHPLRIKLLAFIDSNEEINVNKIYNTLGLEQSITSQHLRILRLAKVVTTQRDGKYIHYSIDYDRLGSTINYIRAFEKAYYNAEEEEEGEE